MKKIEKCFIVILVIAPIIATIIVWRVFKINDIGSYCGGLLSYLGTVTLGVVAYIQNSRLHKIERITKRTKINFTGNFQISKQKVNTNLINNCKKYPSNFYLLSDNASYKGEYLLDFIFPIEIEGYSLKAISLNNVTINENQSNEINLVINKDIKTELVYSVKNKKYQIEIVVICAELKIIKKLINSDDFIMSLNYELLSFADVKTSYTAKLNFGKFDIDNKEKEMNNIYYMEETNE